MIVPKRMVYKVQRPLASTDPDPKCLVYPQSRYPVFEIPCDKPVMAMMGRDLKMYVEAELTEKGVFTIVSRVKAQDW